VIFFRLLWFAEERQRVYGDIIPVALALAKILVTAASRRRRRLHHAVEFPSSMIAESSAGVGRRLAPSVINLRHKHPIRPSWGALAEMAGIPAGVVNVLTGRPAPSAAN